MKTVSPLFLHYFRALALAGLTALAVACGPSPTAIHGAVRENNLEEARNLLERGVDVNHPDSDGATALDYAVTSGNLEMAQLLITQGGADVNAANTLNDNRRPLHEAVALGRRDMVELLIRHGARVDARDDKGLTPLALADERGHKDLVILLRAHGARQ